jgi:hypothetical protein
MKSTHTHSRSARGPKAVVVDQIPDDAKQIWAGVSHFRSFDGGIPSILGRVEYFSELLTKIDDHLKTKPNEVQATRDLVITTVSGAGKTRSLISLRRQLRARELSIYTGFNCSLALTEQERSHMSSTDGVFQVVLRRVIAMLTLALSRKYNEDGDADDLPDCHQLFPGSKAWEFYSVDACTSYIREMMSRHNLTLLVCGVDEIQNLDEMQVGPHGAQIGCGRLMLRCLRHLQWHPDPTQCLPIIAIGCGVQPNFFLEDKTQGRHLPLSHLHIEFLSMRTVVDTAVANAEPTEGRSPNYTDAELNALCLCLWPRVRDAIVTIQKPTELPSYSPTCSDWRELLRDIILGRETRLGSFTDIPHTINDGMDRAQVLLDMPTLNAACDLLPMPAFSVPELRINPRETLKQNLVRLTHAAHPHGFEDAAFKALAAYFSLAQLCTPKERATRMGQSDETAKLLMSILAGVPKDTSFTHVFPESDAANFPQFPFTSVQLKAGVSITGLLTEVKLQINDPTAQAFAINCASTTASGDFIFLWRRKDGRWVCFIVDAKSGQGQGRAQVFNFGYALHCCLGARLARVHLGAVSRNDSNSPMCIEVNKSHQAAAQKFVAFELQSPSTMADYLAKLDSFPSASNVSLSSKLQSSSPKPADPTGSQHSLCFILFQGSIRIESMSRHYIKLTKY